MFCGQVKDSLPCSGKSGEGTLPLLVLALLALILLAGAPNVQALSDPNTPVQFHGVWIGKSVIAEKPPRGSILTARDIDMAIRETEAGFEMSWKSLSHEEARRIRATFVATSEPGHFTASGVEPPLSGKDKLQARMEGDSLVVYLSKFGDHGVERVARYQLSVSDGQMTFRYTLSRGGELLESVKGSLSKAKVVL